MEVQFHARQANPDDPYTTYGFSLALNLPQPTHPSERLIAPLAAFELPPNEERTVRIGSRLLGTLDPVPMDLPDMVTLARSLADYASNSRYPEEFRTVAEGMVRTLAHFANTVAEPSPRPQQEFSPNPTIRLCYGDVTRLMSDDQLSGSPPQGFSIRFEEGDVDPTNQQIMRASLTQTATEAALPDPLNALTAQLDDDPSQIGPLIPALIRPLAENIADYAVSTVSTAFEMGTEADFTNSEIAAANDVSTRAGAMSVVLHQAGRFLKGSGYDPSP
jgi:hypothetical protein